MNELTIGQRASGIKLLLMDCDGVLTDGRLWLLADDEQQKTFHARDGLGLDLLHSCGIQTGVISGLTSAALERRARALNISYVRQGNPHKIGAFQEIVASAGVETHRVAYVGDDLTDLPLLKRSGLAIAVANAVAEVKAGAHYTTEMAGGMGAVREVAELILKSQGRWDEIIGRYSK